jgi:hypothetical protein
VYPASAFAIWKSPGCRKVPGLFYVHRFTLRSALVSRRGHTFQTSRRLLRRPIIDPVLRPNAWPITACALPAAFNSSSRLSSWGVHGLLLFFGMAC